HLFLSGVNHRFNSTADLRDGIHARVGRRRDHADIAAFQSDVVILPALLVGFTEQLGCEPDVVSKDDNLMAFGKNDDAVAYLMDASIVHACYRIIKDYG